MTWRLFWILCEMQVAIVFLIDMSGGVDSLKAALGRWLGIKGAITLKPFDCSLCLTHWTGLIYLLCSGQLTLLAYMVVCLLALGTTITERLLTKITYLLNRFIDWL